MCFKLPIALLPQSKCFVNNLNWQYTYDMNKTYPHWSFQRKCQLISVVTVRRNVAYSMWLVCFVFQNDNNEHWCSVYSTLVFSLQYIGVQFTVHWCSVYSTLVFSLQYIDVQLTVYWCSVYSTLVFSLQYIGVQFTVHWCSVYSTLVFSLQYISVQFTAHWIQLTMPIVQPFNCDLY